MTIANTTKPPRPAYNELLARIAGDLSAVPEALREPLGGAHARACHGLWGFLEWIDRQCSPLTCDLDRLYDWAALYGVYRLLPVPASGAALATGNAGTIVPKDTLLRGQNGLDYIVTEAIALGVGSTPVNVVCDTAGEIGNLAAGQGLTLVAPVVGVASLLAAGPDGITGGAEEETLDAWRIRVADEWQNATTFGARGGRLEDYKYWARSAHPAVSTALVYRHALGMGTVLARPICNGLANRLPSASIISAVEKYLLKVAPATADWRVRPAVPKPVSFTIHLLHGVDTTANRIAITAALADAVNAEVSESSTLLMAEVDVAISTVTSQYQRQAPAADVSVAAGEVLVMGPVTWS